SVITYAEDPATGEYYIETIATTTAVDYSTKQRQIRTQVVQSRQLEQRLATHTDRPLQYSGIGARIELSQEGDGVWVRPISDAAPAAKCGLQVGDKVVAIDGRLVSDFSHLGEISAAIRGPAGSVVTLTIRQPDGTEKVRQVRREFYRYVPPANPPPTQ
ncbi:MAG: PDZ domain-containing protein, partial [Spartobacteria bacterium]|nr:PDZ domain-containing protein [Spartobacteria bacterium]